MSKALLVGTLWTLAGVGSLLAQAPTVTVGPLPCLPLDANGVVTATVSPDAAGTSVRLYFRRLNVEVEDFYYTEMHPTGSGGYWGIFPQPQDRPADKKALKNEKDYVWARWWKAKEKAANRDPNPDLDQKVIDEKAPVGKLEKRTWMDQRDDEAFQKWLEQLQNEPAEFYVAVYSSCGTMVAKSAMAVTEVRKDCKVTLTPQQAGYAANLTVGETNVWQKDEDVFHWQCDGVVTRINPSCVPRADDKCRACVVAWWAQPWVPVAATVLVGVPLINIIEKPTPVSPSQP